MEDENLTNVLCEIISKILGPFNYRDINSNENKVNHSYTVIAIIIRLTVIISHFY